jgi:hypothetical protein
MSGLSQQDCVLPRILPRHPFIRCQTLGEAEWYVLKEALCPAYAVKAGLVRTHNYIPHWYIRLDNQFSLLFFRSSLVVICLLDDTQPAQCPSIARGTSETGQVELVTSDMRGDGWEGDLRRPEATRGDSQKVPKATDY